LYPADRHVWFGVSVEEYLGKLILEHVSEDTSGQLAHLGRPFLSQLDRSQHVAPPFIGGLIYRRVILFGNDEVLLNQILSGGALDHNI